MTLFLGSLIISCIVGLFPLCKSEMIPHKFSEWTVNINENGKVNCRSNRTCLKCGHIEFAGSHKYIYTPEYATCGDTQTALCEVCGDTYTEELQHSYINHVCWKCRTVDPDFDDGPQSY
jgi:hypothetical protein